MNPLKDSAEYQEAITATTQGWSDTGVAITEKDTVQNLTSISRQLNSILFTVIKLRQEVAELRKGKVPAQDISQLIEQLDKTHLSPQGASFKRDKGTIKVYRNPFDVLKQIQEESKKPPSK